MIHDRRFEYGTNTTEDPLPLPLTLPSLLSSSPSFGRSNPNFDM
jgi:hypothetical protein